MPCDEDEKAHLRPSLTAAVAGLMAVDRLCHDDAAMRAALRAAVAGTRDPVDTLWDQYRGGRPGRLRTIRRVAR